MRERDTTIEAPSSVSRVETWIGVRVPSADTSQAPSPTTPMKARPHAGAVMTPSVARPRSASPIITANSPFFAQNSRVPSSGSTNHTASDFSNPAYERGSLSSATIGMPGNARLRRSTRSAFDSWSARVTGSFLPL